MYKSLSDIQEERNKANKQLAKGCLVAIFLSIPSVIVLSIKTVVHGLFWVLCAIILWNWIYGVPLDINNFIRW